MSARPSPSRAVPEISICALITPLGRVILSGLVPELQPFEELEPPEHLPTETRYELSPAMWMRWAGPQDTGLQGPRIEFAVSTRADERRRTATIVARIGTLEPEVSGVLYDFLAPRGGADLVLFERDDAGGVSARAMHWIVAVDLTQKLEQFGLSAEGTPTRYL